MCLEAPRTTRGVKRRVIGGTGRSSRTGPGLSRNRTTYRPRASEGRENARWPEPGGCSAAWATQVAKLAVAGAGVCRRCDAVGAVKTTELAGARGCSAAEYSKGAGAAADYCTRAEECVKGSTAPVRRRGLDYRDETRGSVL